MMLRSEQRDMTASSAVYSFYVPTWYVIGPIFIYWIWSSGGTTVSSQDVAQIGLNVVGGISCGLSPPDPLSPDHQRTATSPPAAVTRTGTIGGSRVLDCDLTRQSMLGVGSVRGGPGGPAVGPGSLSSVVGVDGQLSAEHLMTWRHQGQEVPVFIQYNGYPPHVDEQYKNRIRMVEPASIEISDLRPRDAGWYECSVVFLEGALAEEQNSVNGSCVYLVVQAPPVLGDVSPSFLIHKEGDTVELFCEATASPDPVVAWHKDDKEIVSGDRITVRDTRVQIRSVTRSDGGAYSCTFKNKVGHVTHVIKLVIEGNAYIMVPPKNTTAVEGSRVKLNCQAEGHPNNITYRWYRNSIDTQHVAGLSSRASIYADGSLVISAASKEDSGWYVCRPTNGVGPAPEAQAYLNITYFARVHSIQPRVFLPRGLAGRLDCPTDANPPTTHVTWSKNERVIIETTFATSASVASRFKVSRQGSLIIRPVEPEDEGRYSCTPTSSLGGGQPSTPIQVFVREPPHLLVKPRVLYQRQRNQSVVMPCVAVGDPNPAITWKKVRGSMPPSSRVMMDGGNLTIMNLSKDDHGTYECIATNVVATAVASTLLIVEVTTPHPPNNVSVEMTTSTARLSWLPAFESGYMQHYVIWYRVLGTSSSGKSRVDAAASPRSVDSWQTVRVVPTDVYSIVIHRLLPSTMYQFMVLARNRLGDGLFSQAVNGTTLAGEVRPLNVTPIRAAEPVPMTSGGPENQLDNPNPHYTVTKQRPLPPSNVTAQWLRSYVHISWQPPPRHRQHQHRNVPSNGAVPPSSLGDGEDEFDETADDDDSDYVDYSEMEGDDDEPEPDSSDRNRLPVPVRYNIEYRTVGQWVQLTSVNGSVTSYDWKTSSRGAVYHFRILSGAANDELSEPSVEVVLRTSDPQKEGVTVTSTMIGAVLGALLLVFVAVVTIAVAVKFFIKRKRREKSIRFGNVKYFGPNHAQEQYNGGSRIPDENNPLTHNLLASQTAGMTSMHSVLTDIDLALPIQTNHVMDQTPIKQAPTLERKPIKETPI